MSSLDKPSILILINKIVKKRTPLIVARAFTMYYRERLQMNITEEYRNDLRFSENLHRRHYHKNMMINKCNCAYCTVSKEYTELKLQRHRHKRLLYSEFTIVDAETIFQSLAEYDERIRRLKSIKTDLQRKLDVPVIK